MHIAKKIDALSRELFITYLLNPQLLKLVYWLHSQLPHRLNESLHFFLSHRQTQLGSCLV